MNLWPLLGIAVVVAGFLARLNPLLVIVAAAGVTGIAAGISPPDVVATFGKAFKDNRYISLVWLILPVIGLLEQAGLQEKARELIARVRGATTGRLLLPYLVIRQITAALGLTSLGGHPQMVRPLIAPMAEAAAEARHGPLPDDLQQTIRAQAAVRPAPAPGLSICCATKSTSSSSTTTPQAPAEAASARCTMNEA